MKLAYFVGAFLLGIALFATSCVHAQQQPLWIGNYAFGASSAPGPNGTTVGWTGCRSTAPPPYGCDIQFLAPDAGGRMVSGVTFNGGVIEGQGPTTNSDIDIVGTVDNKIAVIAITGKYQGSPPMMHTWPAGTYLLGGPATYFAGMWLEKYSCPISLARAVPEPDHCVQVNGAYVPVYR